MLKTQLHRVSCPQDMRKYENFAKQKIVGWLPPPPVGYEGLKTSEYRLKNRSERRLETRLK